MPLRGERHCAHAPVMRGGSSHYETPLLERLQRPRQVRRVASKPFGQRPDGERALGVHPPESVCLNRAQLESLEAGKLVILEPEGCAVEERGDLLRKRIVTRQLGHVIPVYYR